MLPYDQRRVGGKDGERCTASSADECGGVEEGVGGFGEAVSEQAE